MKKEIILAGDYAIFKIKGSMATEYLTEIEKEMRALLNKQVHIVCDLSEVSFICSMGLAMFHKSIKILMMKNKRLVLSGVNEEIKQIFEVTGSDKVMEITENVDDAIAMIAK
jgi:anti-anti-sigma factor